MSGVYFDKDGNPLGDRRLRAPERMYDRADVKTRKMYKMLGKLKPAAAKAAAPAGEARAPKEVRAPGPAVAPTKKRAILASGLSQTLTTNGRLIAAPTAQVYSLDGQIASKEESEIGKVFASDYPCTVSYRNVDYPSFIHALSAARWDYVETKDGQPVDGGKVEKFQTLIVDAQSGEVARELGSVQRMKREKVQPSPEWRNNVCSVARDLIQKKAKVPAVRAALDVVQKMNLEIVVLSPPEDLSWGARAPKSLARDIEGRNELGNMWLKLR